MVNSIAPMWDGNETWLVLGGGGLFAVFPLAYAMIMPALYPTIIAMLLGAGLPRRRVRVPLPRPNAARPQAVGFRLLRRLDRRGAVPGADARRAAAGHPRGRSPMPAAGSIG